ncbi:hypothetical protein BLNAU_22476 [Blattamonas nauphoetae]|uniref:Uncharacterized protein n=1 Tax=Blattamonas nauphoetae TaxID=2049346 RepID=A0ABQ9WX74_9EUKA|nr:hypothetical protein BLNAU_22476 [Blattamonas nauphoetae]
MCIIETSMVKSDSELFCPLTFSPSCPISLDVSSGRLGGATLPTLTQLISNFIRSSLLLLLSSHSFVMSLLNSQTQKENKSSEGIVETEGECSIDWIKDHSHSILVDCIVGLGCTSRTVPSCSSVSLIADSYRPDAKTAMTQFSSCVGMNVVRSLLILSQRSKEMFEMKIALVDNDLGASGSDHGDMNESGVTPEHAFVLLVSFVFTQIKRNKGKIRPCISLLALDTHHSSSANLARRIANITPADTNIFAEEEESSRHEGSTEIERSGGEAGRSDQPNRADRRVYHQIVGDMSEQDQARGAIHVGRRGGAEAKGGGEGESGGRDERRVRCSSCGTVSEDHGRGSEADERRAREGEGPPAERRGRQTQKRTAQTGLQNRVNVHLPPLNQNSSRWMTTFSESMNCLPINSDTIPSKQFPSRMTNAKSCENERINGQKPDSGISSKVVLPLADQVAGIGDIAPFADNFEKSEIKTNGLIDILPFQVEELITCTTYFVLTCGEHQRTYCGVRERFRHHSTLRVFVLLDAIRPDSHTSIPFSSSYHFITESFPLPASCTAPRHQQSHDITLPAYPIAVIPHLTLSHL